MHYTYLADATDVFEALDGVNPALLEQTLRKLSGLAWAWSDQDGAFVLESDELLRFPMTCELIAMPALEHSERERYDCGQAGRMIEFAPLRRSDSPFVP